MNVTRTQVKSHNTDRMNIIHINVNGILAKRIKMQNFV